LSHKTALKVIEEENRKSPKKRWFKEIKFLTPERFLYIILYNEVRISR